ncbi:hypothetical protein MUP95_04995, partial [bacterium]|nr:hypothetical protein [bacterium]
FKQNYSYLFVSATPRLYQDETCSINNFEITGQIEYSYDYGLAIKNEYICDYEIFIPDISVKNIDQIQNVFNR